ncbi:hypothetical protein K431DRAFT_218858 [Polychaeton citri CBS 116435]|uniref:Uncharacterized protein n=1 Tax=Polychaeton citri CBS 116435 TaxID=1314669 RepID=A0A9P4QCB7_9PEZI|nr:hypothetical protein K431DRAFT_218858 [Polychaeton citri CBS 116435]
MTNVKSTMNADVFVDTAKTAHLRAQPNFHGKTQRQHALRDLLASVPAESRRIAQVDRHYLDNALKEFRQGAVTADGNGDWKVNGMKSTLKHYQVLGVSFMRKREKDDQEPRGGILADEMGLGKTVMMLANIVAGRPRDKEVPKTTLVVASPALIRQWKEEIIKHCRTRQESVNGVGRTLTYRSKDFKHLGLDEAEKAIRKSDIVLTTYQEIIKSYPKAPIPPELVTAGQKDKWWQEHFIKNRDALHRVRFHRIVLDEAQAIKNHTGLTSMACRSVNAAHHWAISGTPIMNTIKEFYPYFKFIKEPHTGTFKIFKENFCSPDDPDGTIKLNVFLGKFMIRRTHVDRLFDARLLDLPKPTEETVEVEFNETERQIYEIIRNRFVQRIKCIAESSDPNTKKCNHVWTMVLRLRQVCSHLLLAQDTLTDILEREDFERLSRLMLFDQQEQEEQGLTTMLRLKELFTHTALDNLKRQETELGQCTSHQLSAVPSNFIDIAEAEDRVGNMHGLKFNFDRIIQDLVKSKNFDEICERSRCACCRQNPHNPHVTSCYHIYCFDCLEHMQHKAARRGHDDARCLQCGEHFDDSQPCQDFESIIGKRKDSSDQIDEGKSGKANLARWVNMPGHVLPSAKTIALKMRVLQWLEEDPECKIIVYSQFLDMIKILGRVCEMERWGHCKYTGAMSHSARDRALQDFKERPDKNILLASLKCGGIGLNLTMASRVVCLDPWWNNAIEQQAFCRVFRIGQQKETFMTRLIVKNSIDTAMMALKERKRVEIDQVMDEDRKKEGFTFAELTALFIPQSSVDGDEDDGRGERKPFIFAAQDDEHDPEEGMRIVDVEEEDYELPHAMGHEA